MRVAVLLLAIGVSAEFATVTFASHGGSGRQSCKRGYTWDFNKRVCVKKTGKKTKSRSPSALLSIARNSYS
ncbi:MAG: hypothetical protein AAGF54_01765 [Pseudomonadota bacterium]